MAEQGGCNFDCIVASGPNSGYPHYNSFDRVIQEGDCIVLDWGCAINEMMSDLSRTVFVGSISDEQRRIYEPGRQSPADCPEHRQGRRIHTRYR